MNRFVWREAGFPSLNAALRAVAEAPVSEALISTDRGLLYTYNPDTGELWRLREKGGIQRMGNRLFRRAA